MAATKTAKTKNPDRKGADGKAWKKSHGTPARVLSPEAQERKSAKEVRRGQRISPQAKPGSNITMPKITWLWAQEMMASRWPNTKRLRTLDAVLAEERRGGRQQAA